MAKPPVRQSLVFQNYQVDAAIGQLGQNARLIPVQAPEATNYPLTISR